MLGTLADNGGPTPTMALLSGSPDIDQIPTSDPLCSPSSSDQRGQARPDELETACDIGDYEFQDQSATTTALIFSANPSVGGQPVTYTASVSPTPDGGTVSFQDDGTDIGGCGSVAVSTSGTSAGTATCTVTYPTTGSHSITASYSGDANFLHSTTTPPTVQYVDTDRSGYTTLSNVNLSGDYLGGANLAGVDLSNTNLKNFNLTDANLTGANLTGANLTDANLTNADLKGAMGMSTATLTGITWSGTMCPDGTSSGKDGGTCVSNLAS